MTERPQARPRGDHTPSIILSPDDCCPCTQVRLGAPRAGNWPLTPCERWSHWVERACKTQKRACLRRRVTTGKAPSAVCRMSSRLSSTNSARDVRRTDHPMNTRVRCSTRTIFALLPELGGHPLLVPPGDARDARTRPRRAPRGKTRSTRSGPRAGQALDVFYHRLAPARPHCWLLRGWRLRGGTSEHGRVRRWEGRSPDCGRGSRPRFVGL
jgi:hypothetical protein